MLKSLTVISQVLWTSVVSGGNAIYLRFIEAGAGKRTGLPLSGGFMICPAKFGSMAVECVADDAKYEDISANGVKRREWNKPFTFKGDYPSAIRPLMPKLGKLTLRCIAFKGSKFSSTQIMGMVDCPAGLTYNQNSTHVYAVKKNGEMSMNTSPSPTSSPKSEGKQNSASDSYKSQSFIMRGMYLRLVHAGYDGDKKTIAVLKDGFKIMDSKNKSVVCDAP